MLLFEDLSIMYNSTQHGATILLDWGLADISKSPEIQSCILSCQVGNYSFSNPVSHIFSVFSRMWFWTPIHETNNRPNSLVQDKFFPLWKFSKLGCVWFENVFASFFNSVSWNLNTEFQIMSPFNFFVDFLYVVTSSSGIVEELQGAGDYFLDGWFFLLFFFAGNILWRMMLLLQKMYVRPAHVTYDIYMVQFCSINFFLQIFVFGQQ